MSSVTKVEMGKYSVFTGLIHRTRCNHVQCSFPRQLRCKLLIKCQLDPLDVMAQLDGRSQLQVHAFLDCREVQQEQRLSINLLQTHKLTEDAFLAKLSIAV